MKEKTMDEMNENRVFCNECGQVFDEYKGNCPHCTTTTESKPNRKEMNAAWKAHFNKKI
jgi:hypothetical protein